MSLGDDYLAMLDDIDAATRLPRVREVVVPPPGVAGHAFGAVVLADDSVGLMYTQLGDTAPALAARVEHQTFAGADPAALARTLWSGDDASRTLALGLINAVGQHVLARSGLDLDNSADSFASLGPAPEERIGMVGFFPPLVKRLRDVGVPVTVLELREDLVTREKGVEVTLDPQRLQHCTRILCTSSVLLNDTLDDVLAHCPTTSQVAIIGPGAGFLPDPLFTRGVDIVGASRIVATQAFLARCRRGEKWGESSRKYSIARTDYPGAPTLLRRLTA